MSALKSDAPVLKSSDAYGGLRQPIAQPLLYLGLRQRVRERQKPLYETLRVACLRAGVRSDFALRRSKRTQERLVENLCRRLYAALTVRL
ncbi:MAG: hypothetical protein V7L29_02875 [Nostoc sp.]|uniref:hypothetical protein n=1 Tax=Nostoc sp. TaxID=1180 RepID=UPI002FFCF965